MENILMGSLFMRQGHPKIRRPCKGRDSSYIVTPYVFFAVEGLEAWIPASAGMTKGQGHKHCSSSFGWLMGKLNHCPFVQASPPDGSHRYKESFLPELPSSTDVR